MNRSVTRPTALFAGLALFGVALLCLLVAPADAAAGKNGTARYKYKVVDVEYAAFGDLVGGRGLGGCVAGQDASWIGHVTTDAELSSLGGKVGDGKIRIGKHGTSGHVEAKVGVRSEFSNAEHVLVTECNGDGFHPGQATNFTTTQCTDELYPDLHVSGKLAGKVGHKVKIRWDFFGQEGTFFDPEGAWDWVPDSFSCVETFEFPAADCQSQAKLKQFTKKKLTLPFRCMARTFSPPPGTNITLFSAQAQVEGSLKLKRTKHG